MLPLAMMADISLSNGVQAYVTEDGLVVVGEWAFCYALVLYMVCQLHQGLGVAIPGRKTSTSFELRIRRGNATRYEPSRFYLLFLCSYSVSRGRLILQGDAIQDMIKLTPWVTFNSSSSSLLKHNLRHPNYQSISN